MSVDRTEEWGEPIGDFTVERTPRGYEPEEIRKAWVGLSMPVRLGAIAAHMETSFPMYTARGSRTLVINRNPVPIVTEEAVDALRAAGQEAAATFWETAQDVGPLLVFHGSEGTFGLRSEQSNGPAATGPLEESAA